MTHRAVITRNTVATTDAWNRPDPPTFTALKTIACRAWVKTKKEVRDDGKEVVVSDHRAIFPLDDNKSAEPLPCEILEVHAM